MDNDKSKYFNGYRPMNWFIAGSNNASDGDIVIDTSNNNKIYCLVNNELVLIKEDITEDITEEIYVIEYDNGMDYEANKTYTSKEFFLSYEKAKKFLMKDYDVQVSKGEEYFSEMCYGQSYCQTAYIVKLKLHKEEI